VRYNDTGSLEELQGEPSVEPSCLALEALLPPSDGEGERRGAEGRERIGPVLQVCIGPILVSEFWTI
jgi:hypothetical protein